MSERNIYLDDIPLEEAQSRLENALREAGRYDPFPGEMLPLAQAAGRITAGPIMAKLSSPHYHAAAMDGYAVHAVDTFQASETRPILLLLGEKAYPVNTGDPLPRETNAVIMIEQTQQPTSEFIEIRASAAPYQHVRLMGEDMVATEIILPANHRLRPVDLGALAGCGHAEVNVRRRPRVVIIPTGSELIPITQTPEPGQIIEYNSLMLSAQIHEWGGAAEIDERVPDQIQALHAAVDQALSTQPDLILLLSGSAAGSRDFSASILREKGTLLAHGVAVRPGHPVILGMIGPIPVIGIPGYPVSAALTGEIFVRPLLLRWQDIDPAQESRPTVEAVMTRKLASPPGDDDFVRVTLGKVGDRLLAAPLNRGAGVISSLVRADGLAHIPRFSEGVNAGQMVAVELYRPLSLIENTVVSMGSHDPMLDLLGQFLAELVPGSRLTSAGVGSLGGLIALGRDEAHLAGIHLLDTETGEYNIAYVQRYLPDQALKLITFAHREQGFLVAKGNPLNIHSVEDLPRSRYVNRQRGAGTRVLLDFELSKRGIAPESISGYAHEESTHMGVAAAVASGIADCGMGVRSAAVSLDLDFVPVGWERFDLVIPARHNDHPGVAGVVALLNDPAFREVLGAQPGYHTGETGLIQWMI